jgi:hypothetical protein
MNEEFNNPPPYILNFLMHKVVLRLDQDVLCVKIASEKAGKCPQCHYLSPVRIKISPLLSLKEHRRKVYFGLVFQVCTGN